MASHSPKLYDIVGRMESVVSRIIRKGSDFGKPSVLPAKEKVVIDFSSPNIGKPFHLGHFRATVTGHFIRNINELMGHDVIAINYIGDHGRQFQRLIAGFEKYGSILALENYGTRHLFEVYSKLYKYGLESVDYDIKNERRHQKLWKLFSEVTMSDLRETYKKLGINFTVFNYESEYVGKAREMASKLIELGHAFVDGNEVLLATKEEPFPRLISRDGKTLYLTRDIAAAKERIEMYNCDRLHYVVMDEQAGHFTLLEETLHKLGYSDVLGKNKHWGLHIPFGRVAGQSTRRGEVLFLRDLLNVQTAKMKSRLHEHRSRITTDFDFVAETLAYSVLLESTFSSPRTKPVSLAMGDSPEGIRSHYCHVRLNSLIENAAEAGLEPTLDADGVIYLLSNHDVTEMLLHLHQYEEVLQSCYESFDPCQLIHYMRTITSKTGRLLKKVRVVDNKNKIHATANLALFIAIRQVIRNIFHLLGIKPLDKL